MPLSPDPSGFNVGGKARALLELHAAGFRVPEFLCAPDDLEEALRLLGTPVAVRSSASLEDGRRVSFAGQFKSFLNLRTVSEVKAAVQQCQESVHAPGVLEYCRIQGVDPARLRMGYFLQRMVQPELAGVVFTVNPSTGAEEIVIEACPGLADELLLGRKPALSPNHFLMRKHGGEIGALAKRIQRHFGTPQDIEFAIEKGVLYVLQARPITKIQFGAESTVWTNADFRDGGVSAGVCTPLMWSLYDYIWESTLKGFLREIKLLDGDFQAARLFFGRPYWNLGEVKRCLAKLPGFNERKFDNDLSVQPAYEGDGTCTPVSLQGILRATPTIWAIYSLWSRQARFDREFLSGGFEKLTRESEPVGVAPDTAFGRLVVGAYQVTESNYFRTIFCASLAKLDFMDSFPEANDAALMAGLPRLRHLEPLQALREMRKQGALDLPAILERFKHHSRRELDIRAPRWDEDPDWVQTLFQQCSDHDGFDPKQAYDEAYAAVLSRIPWHRRPSFQRKLKRLRTFLWLREEMRDLSSRMYYILRRQVLAMAERRKLGDDIFFMTFREILRDDRSRVARGRANYESYRNFKAPNEIGGGLMFEAAPRPGALRGIVASRGVVRGIARVARSIEEAVSIELGAILVCPFTDPGWAPILSRVSGVITETGGLLSHAAIICRECGVPAVLSVPDATNRIPDGSRVTLRADEGLVEVDELPTQAQSLNGSEKGSETPNSLAVSDPQPPNHSP